MSERVDLRSLDAEAFSARIGDVFRLERPGGEAVDLTLTGVQTTPTVSPAAPRRGFSIVFLSAVPQHLKQGIYTLTHEGMGTLDLFLVPIGPAGGGMRYEAVFN